MRFEQNHHLLGGREGIPVEKATHDLMDHLFHSGQEV
jgi:hypothetical protein